jgi:hypothetical protein
MVREIGKSGENKFMTTTPTAEEILKEINSYSVEIRNGFMDTITETTQELNDVSLQKRLEYKMENDEEGVLDLLDWARNYQ